MFAIIPVNAGIKYVDRGDPAALDFTVGDFITDNTWRELDLFPIVGAGVKLVLLFIDVWDADTVFQYEFRQKGNANAFNIAKRKAIASGFGFYEDIEVLTDVNGKIEYRMSSGTYDTIDVLVRGWFVA